MSASTSAQCRRIAATAAATLPPYWTPTASTPSLSGPAPASNAFEGALAAGAVVWAAARARSSLGGGLRGVHGATSRRRKAASAPCVSLTAAGGRTGGRAHARVRLCVSACACVRRMAIASQARARAWWCVCGEGDGARDDKYGVRAEARPARAKRVLDRTFLSTHAARRSPRRRMSARVPASASASSRARQFVASGVESLGGRVERLAPRARRGDERQRRRLHRRRRRALSRAKDSQAHRRRGRVPGERTQAKRARQALLLAPCRRLPPHRREGQSTRADNRAVDTPRPVARRRSRPEGAPARLGSGSRCAHAHHHPHAAAVARAAP